MRTDCPQRGKKTRLFRGDADKMSSSGAIYRGFLGRCGQVVLIADQTTGCRSGSPLSISERQSALVGIPVRIFRFVLLCFGSAFWLAFFASVRFSGPPIPLRSTFRPAHAAWPVRLVPGL